MSDRMWRNSTLRDHYDVVVIGGGGHGLATAYYLARLGLNNVAVLEARYIGYGGSGRNTAILRSNYRTEPGVRFFDESLKLYEGLAQELDFNVMFSQRGHLTLAHNESSLATMVTRAGVNRSLGVDSRVLGLGELGTLVPELDLSDRPRFPVLGALYHPPGGIIRHDAVVWGYARGADRLGVEIHNGTRVERILVDKGRVVGVKTNLGKISCERVVTATAGWTSEVCGTVGLRLPLATYPLQAFVSESYKPWLKHVIVSSNLHSYLSQTDRGELVCGAGIDSYPHYQMRSTLDFVEELAGHLIELFPKLSTVRVQRQWTGLCDMTPDFSPIISTVDQIGGLVLNCGWGTYGFKATPASGWNTAKLITDGVPPENIKPFDLKRFRSGDLVGEKAAASVSS